MKLITEVTVDHFRSIRDQEIGDLGHFTALAGLNNSGKSNFLRALNLFFNNQTDMGAPFDFDGDYFCHDRMRKAKRVSITVKFDLPQTFKFRKKLEDVEKLLGRSFVLRKLWTKNSIAPLYYLNGSHSQLDQGQQGLVDQFLSLISFRYIPNRVLPLDIIRDEHKALRDVLIRRLAKKAKQQQHVFKAIEKTSSHLIKSLLNSVHDVCPEVGSLRLATPSSWQDLIFAFGYKLNVKGVEIDDTAQGSGIQSLLMFETLALIDRDYFQKFGWRQAAIWAVEEPESSLHSSLEATVSNYLGSLANNVNNRLQIFGTTHSNLILQYSDKSIFVIMNNGETEFKINEKKDVLEEAARHGISHWTHPILHYPLNPVVLVEGKYDWAFLDQALKLLAPHRTVYVSYLELLQGEGVTGGKDSLLQYVKTNKNAIKARSRSAPVIVLLDWDSANSVDAFKKQFSDVDPFKVFAWPETAFNPELGKSFKGIERHMSTRIIEDADKELKLIARRENGTRLVCKDDLSKIKKAAYDIIVNTGIKEDDLQYSRPFLQKLLDSLL